MLNAALSKRMNEPNNTSSSLCAGKALSEGNQHFIYKRYLSAIDAYSNGLATVEAEEDHCKNVETPPENKLAVWLELLSNRAGCYLAIGNYQGAEQDAKRLLEKEPSHFKGIVRYSKALAGLRKYETAIDHLTQAKDRVKGDNRKDLESFLEKLRRMKHQSETGDFYDVPKIIDKPYQPAPPEWVDHLGKVKVEQIAGRGRGLVAVEDIPAGKLVCACRAFEVIFLGEDNDPEEGISDESGRILEQAKFRKEDDTTLNLLVRKIYDRLERNPERRAEFYQLHAGNDLGHIDPSSSGSEVLPLDMARIYGICRTNTFANSGDSYPEVEKSVGLWLFPAYVNHQCVGGNSTWKIFSDFLFIRTFRQVKKGEEVLVSYVSPAFPFRARTEVLTKRLGFVCECSLCELDRSLAQSTHQEKDKLKLLVQNQEVRFANLEQSGESSRKDVETSVILLEQIVNKLEKLHPKHGMYNASLLDPLQKLGLKYFGMGEFQKMAKVMERAVSLMKSCMLPHGVADCCLWIIGGYMQMGNFKVAKKWGKVLRDNLILAYGDVQVLKVLGPWILEPMTKWGFII